jgi:hypothetical protein
MKIKMLVSLAGEDFAVMPGQVVDREDGEAIRLIERGYAVPIVAEPEKAVKRAPETRRKGRRQ